VFVHSEQDTRLGDVKSMTAVCPDAKSEKKFRARVNSDLTQAAEVIRTCPAENEHEALIPVVNLNSETNLKKLSRDKSIASHQTDLNKKVKLSDDCDIGTRNADEVEIADRVRQTNTRNGRNSTRINPTPSVVVLIENELDKQLDYEVLKTPKAEPSASSKEISSGLIPIEFSRTSEIVDDPGSSELIFGKESSKTSHVCTICGQVSATKTRLCQHIRTHTLERPYHCKVCAKGFSSSSNLDRHFMMHTKVRPHLCHICGKGFIQKDSLKEHMTAHDGAKLFACGQCGLSFKRISSVRLHRNRFHNVGADHDSTELGGTVHKKAFLCDLCGRSFTLSNSLKLHGKHHRGERPFECKVCEKGFVEKHRLDLHMRSHVNARPFVCRVCDMTFVYSSCLKRHAKIHGGEKAFACTVCGNRYRRAQHLKSHMLTHSGEKPFGCTYCEKSYKNKVDLRFHCERVHKVVASTEIVDCTVTSGGAFDY